MIAQLLGLAAAVGNPVSAPPLDINTALLLLTGYCLLGLGIITWNERHRQIGRLDD